jgi:hypothetical protein
VRERLLGAAIAIAIAGTVRDAIISRLIIPSAKDRDAHD